MRFAWFNTPISRQWAARVNQLKEGYMDVTKNESSVVYTSNLPLSGLGNLIKIASRKGKAHGQSSNDLFEFATKNGFHSTH